MPRQIDSVVLFDSRKCHGNVIGMSEGVVTLMDDELGCNKVRITMVVRSATNRREREMTVIAR